MGYTLLEPGTEIAAWNPDSDLVRFSGDIAGGAAGIDRLEAVIRADQLITKRLGLDGLVFKTAFQELLLEIERVENFHDCPSRIGAVMLFRTREAAEAFSVQYRGGAGVIQACRVEGEAFDTWMEWTSGGSADAKTFGEIVQGKRAHAAAYWRGDVPDSPVFAETLVRGTARIIG